MSRDLLKPTQVKRMVHTISRDALGKAVQIDPEAVPAIEDLIHHHLRRLVLESKGRKITPELVGAQMTGLPAKGKKGATQ